MLNPSTLLQNRYQILQPIGGGGMGNVYLAADLPHGNTRVIVKENRGGDPQLFYTEAALLASLHHPNLPRVSAHWIDSANSAQYLVMDYIMGQTLEQRVHTRGKQSEQEARVWLTQILDAVKYLHENGVIHRDITPHNIILTPGGRAMLVDLGIAKVMQQGTDTAAAAHGLGKPGYAPPEQYYGGTDEHSDVYALGATLYFGLTGTEPPTALERAYGKVLFAIREMNPTVSANTESVIQKALALQGSDRYASVAEMETALRAEPARRILPRVSVSARGLIAGIGVVMVALLVFSLIVIAVLGGRPIPMLSPAAAAIVPLTVTAVGTTGTLVTGTRAPDAVVESFTFLMSGPGYHYTSQVALVAGESLTLVARDNGDGDWLQVRRASGEQGWVRTSAIKPNVPVTTLPIAKEIPPSPMPRATVSPTPVIRFPFKDDFSNPSSGWLVGTSITSTRTYEGGEYRIVVKQANTVSWSTRVGDVREGFDDFWIQVEARRVEGSSGGYGLIFRERVDNDTENDAYFFRVDPTGYYSLRKLVQGDWTYLTGLTYSSNVKIGSATNLLRVTAHGPQIAVFVNGQQLASLTDTTFSRGKIGMFASSGAGETDFHVAFDNFEAGALP